MAVREVDPVESLTDRAYVMLRDAILSNQIIPGERLSVSELARRMKISRTPVREAVQRLIYDGLAEHAPYRGADVVRVGVDDLKQLFVVREVLDGLAARLACGRMNERSRTELREILEEHEQVLSRGAGPTTHIELDVRYHGRVRELAGNPYLTEMLLRIQGKAHVALHSLWRGADARRLALKEHWSIFEALSGGNPDAAEQAARLHVVGLQARLSEAALLLAGEGRRPPDPPRPGARPVVEASR